MNTRPETISFAAHMKVSHDQAWKCQAEWWGCPEVHPKWGEARPRWWGWSWERWKFWYDPWVSGSVFWLWGQGSQEG